MFGFIGKRLYDNGMLCIISIASLYECQKEKYDDAIDNKKILVISIVVIVVSVLISILYSHRLLRYSFILTMFLATFIKRKAIIGMLRKR